MSKSVEVWIGNGDRVAPKVTVSLLSEEEAIKIRALQELAKYNNVIYARTVNLPVQQGIQVGDARLFYYTLLNLSGKHLITGFTINIGAEEGSSMDLTMEQFGHLGQYQIEVTP